ncbi:hypothetical protein J7T55_001573 [Diaporthe amygdali]|uniref:uncharacterized protein n=1 Tax=Phomopsis amygdali TaxID=1214568 RepID=UPI0022FEB961|nr:uncharacterized protein J7T55_001573 [Diaporthe amygdali]KAJ0115163.1 hypothetical protein J7T55_001573 [Diaporthe amygdali]
MATTTKLQFVDPSVAFSQIDPSKQMRLVSLYSSRQNSITCHLNVVPINDPPPYEALSYVWGSAEDLQVLTVDGHAFRVTKNLHASLEHLSLPDGAARVLWVDAICINQGPEQDDLKERSQQVRLMGRIFSGATNVIAYLGEPYPYLFESLEFLTVAAGGQQSQIDQLTQSAGCNVTQICHGLISLFNRAWWNRVWTVQEPLRGRKVTFQLGRLEVAAEMIRDAIYNIVTSNVRTPSAFAELEPTSGETLSTAFTKMAMLSLSYTGTSLLNVLGAFRYRDSADPRDKIYSLMGLLPDTEHIVNIDYTIPPEQLFQDFTLAWIRKYQNLKVLGHLHNPERRVHKKMPSFAVDWAYRPSIQSNGALHNCSLLQNEAFNACKGSKAAWHLESVGQVRATGFIFDSIEDIGAKHVFEFGSSWSTRFKTLEDIVRTANKRIENDQQTPEQALTTIRHTLCMDCKQEAGVYSRLRGKDDEHVLDVWWERTFKPSSPAHSNILAGEGGPIETTAWIASLERSFIFTESGYMGLGPDWCKPGDAVAVMAGGDLPLVLRPVSRRVGDRLDGIPTFEVIGEAYIHGIMDGEALDIKGRAECDFDDFCLI